MVYDTCMANQRKKGIERITLTIPDELLARLEQDAEARGIDRLTLMREAVEHYLQTFKTPRKGGRRK